MTTAGAPHRRTRTESTSRRAAPARVPRRDTAAVEPASRPRRVRAVRRPRRRHAVVGAALPRPPPRRGAAPAPRQRRAPGLLPRGARPGPPSRCRAGTAPRASCCTSSCTGRSASSTGYPAHGRTFARVLLDATHEFCGAERAERARGVVPRCSACTSASRRASGPTGGVHYGWDERLHLGRGRTLAVFTCSVACRVARIGRFDRYERGSSVVPLVDELEGTVVRIATADIYDVADVPTTF